MPGGPMIYIGTRPEPGFIMLRRYEINFGPTSQRDIVSRARAERPSELLLEREEPQERGTSGLGVVQVDNPYGGRSGWNLHAMGRAAYGGREMVGDDTAILRHWYKRIPLQDRVSLFPDDQFAVWGVPRGDPLRAPSGRTGRWVSDECISTLINAATRGAKGVPPLRFMVPARQTTRGVSAPTEGRSRGLIPPIEIVPIDVLYNVYAAGLQCRMTVPRGLSLRQAGRYLGFVTQPEPGETQGQRRARERRDVNRPLDVSAETLYEHWRERVAATTSETRRLILNTAYHRVLVHRFLTSKKSKPRLTPKFAPTRTWREVERRANLIQAYRVFIFDKRGCPVGINLPFIEENGLKVRKLLERKVPHAEFTAGARAAHWTQWLYDEVLTKREGECRFTGIMGLEELLVAVDLLM